MLHCLLQEIHSIRVTKFPFNTLHSIFFHLFIFLLVLFFSSPHQFFLTLLLLSQLLFIFSPFLSFLLITATMSTCVLLSPFIFPFLYFHIPWLLPPDFSLPSSFFLFFHLILFITSALLLLPLLFLFIPPSLLFVPPLTSMQAQSHPSLFVLFLT